jgi:hypothetical protein
VLPERSPFPIAAEQEDTAFRNALSVQGLKTAGSQLFSDAKFPASGVNGEMMEKTAPTVMA